MRLDAHQAHVADHITAAAALGDDRTQQIAASLAAAAGPAVRLALLGALADAANDLNATLIDLPGSPAVTVRLDPADPAQVLVDVRLADAPAGPAGEQAAREPRREEGEPSARISLRLSEALKADIDEAAARDSVSVNAWLIRAATSALDPNPFAGFGAFGRAWSGGNWGGWSDGSGGPGRAGGPSRSAGGHRVTGWING